jgi:excisionase family DNA binding protein
MQTDRAVRMEETHMTLAELPELIKVTAVAEYLGVSKGQAWRMVWSGQLPSLRLSEKVVRVRRSDLEAWLLEKGQVARTA